MHKLLEKFNTIDKLTPAIRRIKNEVRKALKLLPIFASFGCIHFEIFKEILEELGFEMDNSDWEFNGWEHDTWVKFHNHEKKVTYLVYSSWYDSRVTLTKEEYDSK